MSDVSTQPFATGLIYEECLPLGYAVIDSLPTDWELENINDSNESFLRLCATLEEYHPIKQEMDESMIDVYHELTRLELKVNLLLEFVAQVLNRKLTLPERNKIKLSPQGLQWQCDRAPPSESTVKLDLFLFPRYPRPINLFGSVVDVKAKKNMAEVTAAFRGLSENAQDWLEKIIFRFHRRSIASRRLKRT